MAKNLVVALPGHQRLLLLAATIGLAGCSSPVPLPSRSLTSAPSPPLQYGLVTGTLELGAVIETPPLRGTVSLHGVDGKTFATTTSDSPFSIRVPIGTYRLTGRSPQFQNGTEDCRAVDPITVEVGITITVVVLCEGV